MSENNKLSFAAPTWKMPLRLFTLITFFVGAYAFVQSVLVLISDFERQELSMLVVVIYLLVTPLCFAAAALFAYMIHRLSLGTGGGRELVLGFAMMILASVDNLIYVSIHQGDSVSFYILGGIELICFIICFLYFQGMGPKVMALAAAVLLIASTGLELEEAIRYFLIESYYEFTGYYFVQTLLDTLLAVGSLFFVLGLRQGVEVVDKSR